MVAVPMERPLQLDQMEKAAKRVEMIYHPIAMRRRLVAVLTV